MMDKDAKIRQHEGCPNRHHCIKDNSKCCYLVGNRCIVNEYTDNYIFKRGKRV